MTRPWLVIMCHSADTAVQETSRRAVIGGADQFVQDAGLYNETAFRGLDFVLDQASQYGVKVMFTLTNNWKTFDSKYNVRRLLPPNACPRWRQRCDPSPAGPAAMLFMVAPDAPPARALQSY